jgi:MoaA/NifB/PqqE/SkfB family radical SAM enzyme
MCDIWRIREVREIRPQDLAPHMESFRVLKVREVVFSGGEAQLNRDLRVLAEMLRGERIRLTLLTAGLLLRSRAEEVAEYMDEVIVSLDGPPEIHDRIRAVPDAFERLRAGVAAVRALRADIRFSARSTVQRENYHHLRDTVQTARELGVSSISFIATDTSSSAFNREQAWDAGRQQEIGIGVADLPELESEIEKLIEECGDEIRSGFIAENPAKLRRIARHFRASLELVDAEAPRCNAPWVSAVVEADGNVRPCFFHPPVGNIHHATFAEVVNGKEALRFRQSLDVASNPVCRQCVCSLYRPVAADVPIAIAAKG